MDPDLQAALAKGHQVCFLDITLGEKPLGRIKLEIFTPALPKTCNNFHSFCTGSYKQNLQPLGYKSSSIHRIIKNFMIQAGDFTNNDGTGKCNVFTGPGGKFDDEVVGGSVSAEFKETYLMHNKPGVLSMANSGPNTNGSQFFITLAATPWLDGKHVVFGRVLDKASMETVRMLEGVECGGGDKPRVRVGIGECGEL